MIDGEGSYALSLRGKEKGDGTVKVGMERGIHRGCWSGGDLRRSRRDAAVGVAGAVASGGGTEGKAEIIGIRLTGTQTLCIIYKTRRYAIRKRKRKGKKGCVRHGQLSFFSYSFGTLGP